MQIEKIKIEDINPAPYNPRIDLKPGDPEYENLKLSITEFGYIDPLIWNKQTGNLVGGHQRYKILREKGYHVVQVSVVDLPLEREKALNIALNKISGGWDDKKLQLLLSELNDSLDDIKLTGFSVEEFEELISAVPEDTEVINVEEDDFDVQAALDNIQEPETKYGDVWRLGRHLLVCGDATNLEDVQKLMRGQRAALVVTDPPYNVAVKSDSKKLNKDGHASILNDEMADDQFDHFLREVFLNYAKVMDDTAAIYVFHPSSYQRAFENEMRNAGLDIRSQCIWVKNAPTFGWSQYRYQHEPIFYAFKKSSSPAWYGDRKQTTIWRAGLEEEKSLPTSVWEVSRGDVSKYVHPTQKPLELLNIPINNSSKKEDIVLDFFGGSGSTLMTCEQTDRECRLLELDPYFCDVIKQRFETATGIKPVLLNT